MSCFSEEKLPTSFTNEVEYITDNLVVIRSNVRNAKEVSQWVKEYGKRTNTKWNTRFSNPQGQRFAYRKRYVCHHSAYMKVPPELNKKGGSKNTSCEATVTIKVKLNTPSTKKRDRYVQKGLVAVIAFKGEHNHSFTTVEALKYLPMEDCREKFIGYFNDGMAATESYRYHEGTLELDDKLDDLDVAEKVNPPYRAVRYWYDQWCVRNCVPRTENSVIEKLKENLNLYEDKGIKIQFNEDPFALVIVTPIMKNAHNLKSAGEVVFVDSAPSSDPENHCTTFMLCPCAAGAVPLAVIVTKGQTTEAYEQGFKLVKAALEKPFNGKEGPSYFMTDGIEEEVEALSHVWPRSKNLLCIFHVSHSVWKWLWDPKHEIPKENRNRLMRYFQDILYAHSPTHAEEAYKNAPFFVNEFFAVYEKWVEYIQNLWGKKELWCLAFRNEEIRGYSTNSFSEACIRIFRDKVISRISASYTITLLEFVTKHLEKYYRNKFRGFANNLNSSPRLFLLSLKDKASVISDDLIEMVDENLYLIKEDKDTHVVNSKSGCCSCVGGLYGRYCIHLFSVFEHFHFGSRNFQPVKPQDRQEVLSLTLGGKASPGVFYEPLCQENLTDNDIKQILEATSSKPPTTEIVSTSVAAPSINYDKELNKETLATSSENLTISSVYRVDIDECIDYDEKCNEILNEIVKTFREQNDKYKASLNGLNRFLTNLKRVNSISSWETFVCSAEVKNIPVRRTRYTTILPVQPTPSPVQPTSSPVLTTISSVQPAPNTMLVLNPMQPTPSPMLFLSPMQPSPMLFLSSMQSTPTLMLSTPSPMLSTPSPMLPTPSPMLSTPSPMQSALSPMQSAPSPMLSAPSPMLSTPSPMLSTPSPMQSAPSSLQSTPSAMQSAPSPSLDTLSPMKPPCRTYGGKRLLPAQPAAASNEKKLCLSLNC